MARVIEQFRVVRVRPEGGLAGRYPWSPSESYRAALDERARRVEAGLPDDQLEIERRYVIEDDWAPVK